MGCDVKGDGRFGCGVEEEDSITDSEEASGFDSRGERGELGCDAEVNESSEFPLKFNSGVGSILAGEALLVGAAVRELDGVLAIREPGEAEVGL